ncbi:MAG TPA: hypothetical protein VJ719_09840 [Chthoniobacterales bacterium]|nr:hypothetical protein [Chthoniobacterales bacterium]
MPRVWSPGKMWRWIKARPRRYKAFKRLAALAVIAIIGYFAARPVSHVVKAWQARRLAAQASQLIEQEDWKNANRKLQDAFRIWYNEPEVWRVEARLLSRVGQNHEALRWWHKVAETEPLTVADRRDYAAAALSVRDLAVAEEQIEKLAGTNSVRPAADLVLAGMLASLRGYSSRAVGYGTQVLADPAATARDKLGAATLLFSNTDPNSKEYAAAYQNLIEPARSGDDVISLHALTILARQALPRGNGIPADVRHSGPDQSLTAASPSGGQLEADATSNSQSKPSSAAAFSQLTSTQNISLAEIADRLESHPKAQAFHRMLALEVRAQAEPRRAQDLVEEAITKFGKGDDATLVTLSAWLYTRREFENVLKILPLERATLNRDLFIQRVDALAALGRYSELEQMLLSEQSVIDPSMQHMFLAVVRSKMGETVGSANEWERALDEADSLPKLTMLADYAEKNGAPETADAAYARAISKQPTLRSAYAARLRLAQAMGQTENAHKIAEQIVRRWPEDNATRVREIYLRLLLDTSAAAAKAAEDELTALLAKNPWDQSTQNTLALARLRQGRMAAALEAAPQPGPGVPPSAPLAVAWAANGWSERAKEELHKLATVRLLPEERALIAPLLAQ